MLLAKGLEFGLWDQAFADSRQAKSGQAAAGCRPPAWELACMLACLLAASHPPAVQHGCISDAPISLLRPPELALPFTSPFMFILQAV